MSASASERVAYARTDARTPWLAAIVIVACVACVGCKAKAHKCGGVGDVPTAAVARPARGQLQPAPWLQGAHRVAIVNRGSTPLIAAAGRHWVRLFDQAGASHGEATGVGMAQALHVADVDSDGVDDLIVGRGRGRGVMTAPASVVVHLGGRLETQPEEIELPPTSRAQVVGIASDPRHPGRLWIGSFQSKYMVALVQATRDGSGRWHTETLSSHRVVVSVAATDLNGDGTSELVAARPYGATKEQAGFAFVATGAMQKLPTVGGARAVAAAAAGRVLIVAEGWHYRYGQNARALLVTYRKRSCGWDRRVLAHVADRHGYDQIQVADLDSDGELDVIATGDGPAISVPLSGTKGAQAFGKDVAYGAAVADFDGDGQPELVLVGKRPGIWRVPRGS